MQYQRIKGTRDILPEESVKWQYLEQKISNRLERNNYQLIRTPVFEMTELFARGIGEETDVVSKEMYTFVDKSGKSVTLRPELTAPVIRAYVQNNMNQIAPVSKLYYIDSLFRQERPQKGRLRQFHQFGFEIIGSPHPEADAEVIQTMVNIYRSLGITDLKVRLNSIGSRKSRSAYLKVLSDALLPHKEKFCPTCQVRFDKNILRLFDCKSPECQSLMNEHAPHILDHLDAEDQAHFASVRRLLDVADVAYEIDHTLVRGLDYYTRTTFEITSSLLGAQDAICGGGRYDHLVEDLGGQPTPSVGVACGMERLMMVLEAVDALPVKSVPQVYFATLGEESTVTAFDLLAKVRNEGVVAEMDFLRRSLKAQLREAGRKNCVLVVIVGGEELQRGNVVIRNMSTSEQNEVPVNVAVKKIVNFYNQLSV